MAERLANLGYVGLAKESVAGTAITPTDWIPTYKEALTTTLNLVEDNPIAGNKFARYAAVQGLRDHKGTIEFYAEPNTTAKICDILLTRAAVVGTYTFTVTSANATLGATYTNNGVTYTVTATIAAQTTLVATGVSAPTASGTLTKASGTGDATITFSAVVAGPYAYTYSLSTTNPNTYTVDISTGNIVFRFMGVQASKLAPKWDKTELHLEATVSALASFSGAQITSQSGSGPYTLTLDTTYDPTPTNGLVVGDLIRFYDVSAQTTIDATIASIPTATTFTTTTNPTAIAAGDYVYLRPATVSFNLLSPFIWPKTQFCFGTNTVTALAAPQTRLEQGTEWEVDHMFESDSGAPRSGAFDPASLVRLEGDGQFKLKKFFDTPEDLQTWHQINKTALVVRHFSGATNQYEFRITYNNLKYKEGVKPALESDKILYEEGTYIPTWDSTDSAAMSITVINNLASF